MTEKASISRLTALICRAGNQASGQDTRRLAANGRYDPSSIPPESSRPSRRRLSSGSRRDTIRFRSAQRSPRHRRPRYRGTGLSIPAYAREEFPRFPGAVAEQVTSRGVRCGNAASGYALRSVTTSHIRDQTILPRTQRTQAHPSKPLIMTINQRDHVVGLLDHEEWNLQQARGSGLRGSVAGDRRWFMSTLQMNGRRPNSGRLKERTTTEARGVCACSIQHAACGMRYAHTTCCMRIHP